MGRKNDYKRMEQMLQSWIDRATQPSPYENELAQERSQLKGWLNAKDYRNLPTGVNVDLLPLSDYQRMSKMLRGTGDTIARGANNSALAGQQRQLSDDQLLRDWGAAYESKVGGLMDRQAGLTDTLQNLYSNRMNTGIQGSQAQLTNILNRPKGFNWGSLLGMGMQALPSILSAI